MRFLPSSLSVVVHPRFKKGGKKGRKKGEKCFRTNWRAVIAVERGHVPWNRFHGIVDLAAGGMAAGKLELASAMKSATAPP